MTSPSSEGSDRPPFVERYEKCEWKIYDMCTTHRTMRSYQKYYIYCNFYDFTSGNYSEEFKDTLRPDQYTILSSGWFWWLINIWKDTNYISKINFLT